MPKMKLLAMVAAMALFGAACEGWIDEGEGEASSELQPPLLEPVWTDGTLCQLNFKGATSRNADFYYFWNVGTDGILEGATYNTAARPDLFAIFGTASPANETHHVDGFDAYDHTHTVDTNPWDPAYDTTWDLKAVFPGPNYDAATYQVPRSDAQMSSLISAGVLAGPYLLHEVGFDDVVLKVPIICED